MARQENKRLLPKAFQENIDQVDAREQRPSKKHKQTRPSTEKTQQTLFLDEEDDKEDKEEEILYTTPDLVVGEGRTLNYNPTPKPQILVLSGASTAPPFSLGLNRRPDLFSKSGSSSRARGSEQGQHNSLPSRRSHEGSSGRRSSPAGTLPRSDQTREESYDSTTPIHDDINQQGPRRRLAWEGMKRRQWLRHTFTPAHEAIMRAAIPTVRAMLVTSYRAKKCSPWADANKKSAFSGFLKSVWKETGSWLEQRPNRMDNDVAAELPAIEIRKLYDMVGEHRAQMLHKTREIVKNHYNFSRANGDLDGTPRRLREKNGFCCQEGNAKRGGRFLSSIIVKVMSSLFFAADATGYGQGSQTEHMFRPLTGTIIAFVSTLISHCLKEYNENATKSTIKFKGTEHTEGVIPVPPDQEDLGSAMRGEKGTRSGVAAGKVDPFANSLSDLDNEPALSTSIRRADGHRPEVALILPSGTSSLCLEEELDDKVSGSTLSYTQIFLAGEVAPGVGEGNLGVGSKSPVRRFPHKRQRTRRAGEHKSRVVQGEPGLIVATEEANFTRFVHDKNHKDSHDALALLPAVSIKYLTDSTLRSSQQLASPNKGATPAYVPLPLAGKGNGPGRRCVATQPVVSVASRTANNPGSLERIDVDHSEDEKSTASPLSETFPANHYWLVFVEDVDNRHIMDSAMSHQEWLEKLDLSPDQQMCYASGPGKL
ncbi:hypothetical protein MMC07_009480 [Pseudocyphellaria aurata]|nr:hypothetical protein [Pseudocyphellaria aurata]